MPTLRPSLRSALTAARSLRSRPSTTSGCAWAAHWNGVGGLGTPPPMEIVQRTSLRPDAARPALMTLWAMSAIWTTSSSSSVGSPHMKYSLTWRQPCPNASETVRMRSSSDTILLITRRMRSEPPSGANVSPERRALRLVPVAGSVVHAWRRRQRGVGALGAAGQPLGDLGDLGVVGARLRQQPDLVEARGAHGGVDH